MISTWPVSAFCSVLPDCVNCYRKDAKNAKKNRSVNAKFKKPDKSSEHMQGTNRQRRHTGSQVTPLIRPIAPLFFVHSFAFFAVKAGLTVKAKRA
jgi:hypothetical protein